MNKYTELMNSLDDTLDVIAENGIQCTCKEDYVCRICKAKQSLANAELIGDREGIRPRSRIRCITTDKEFDTITDAGTFYGVQPATISKCLKGELKRAGFWMGAKLEWEYIK